MGTVRAKWNDDGPARDKFLQQAEQVQRLKEVVELGVKMVRAAIAFTHSHPAVSITIPGAKSAQQAAMNAQAGERFLSEGEQARLISAVS